MIKDLVAHYRGLLITKFIDNPENLLNMSIENVERLKDQGKSMATEDISRGIIEFSKANLDARYSTQPRILLEVACIKLTRPEENNTSTPKVAKADEQRRHNDCPSEKVSDSKPDEPLNHRYEVVEPLKSEEFTNKGTEQHIAVREDFDKLAGDELWDKALTCIEKEKATFRVARGATCICEINKDCVIIEANSDFMLCRLQDNKELIEATLEELTGERRPIAPRIREEVIIKDKLVSAKETKKEVEQNFVGISVEIDEERE